MIMMMMMMMVMVMTQELRSARRKNLLEYNIVHCKTHSKCIAIHLEYPAIITWKLRVIYGTVINSMENPGYLTI
jgi:hypothetical protein